MTIQRMIELLKIEHECMLRGSHDDCDRKCADCELVQNDDELHEMYTNVIYLLQEHESILEMPNDDGWISVEDHLPEEEGRYIAYSRDEGRESCSFSVGEARYCHVGRDDERKWRGSYGFTYDVTHWRPFPPPPKFHKPDQNDEQ